jgi:large subunit ribosomal protein L29
MKMEELTGMSDQQLTDTLRDACRQLFRLRFQAATEKLDAPSELRKLKKDVARIKTLQRQRELAAVKK